MDSNSLLSMNLALNVARKCRICGMDILDLTCAFPIFGNDRLDQKLERYLQLNIQVDDLLPKCICGSCYLKLESIDQFALMANRTEEAFRAWLGRLRGLSSPAEAAKNVNVMLPLFRLDPAGADTKRGGGGGIYPAQEASHSSSSPAPGSVRYSAPPPVSTIPPEKGIISYSDLKLGLLIKDQELLKLILKALKWAENDRRASFDVLIQRLKNSSFREILSNRNLLNDSDLTQLLKSYIGQGVMNSFAASTVAAPLNNNVVPPMVMLQAPVDVKPMFQMPANVGRVPVGAQPAVGGVGANEYRIDEASVTQMEVGVDPDLYLPYEDEDSSSTTKYEGRMDDRQENTVTIKLVTTNVAGDLIENKRMVPAILNVRGHKRFQCSVCPECFETNGELQQHIVRRHMHRTGRTVITEQGKPAIKIRVRKNKPIPVPLPPKLIQQAPPQPQPLPRAAPVQVLPTPFVPPGNNVPTASSPIKFVPLKIPASTTITVIPAAPSQKDPIPPPPEQKVELKPLQEIKKEPPETVQSPVKEVKPLLVRKSKRKSSLKPEVSSLILEKQRKRSTPKDVVQAVTTPLPKASRKSNAAPFCALCRKRLAAKDTLREHLQQEHARFECEKCDRAFKSAASLSRHQQYHASVMADVASTSKGATTSQRTSKAQENQTYKCNHCEKAFKRNNHLKLHMKFHAKPVPSPSVRVAEEKPSTGNGLRTRAKGKGSGSSGSAISSILLPPVETGSKVRKVEASKRKNTITRKVRFSC